ncbi:MAG: sulfatase-like hydrolase/transferase, partial [Verrucomicrobiota bacterium]
REEWSRYLNSVTGTDVRFGWIMDRLEADGLLEDTVVIFFSDNGRLMPRGIHWPFDEGLRVPMIIRWPKNHPAPPQIKAGKVSDQVVSLVDLTATTMAIAGIEKPLGMQSQNFLGAKPDPARTYAFAARDRIDETEVRMRSVHDDRYHYIRNFTPGAGFLTLNRYKEKCFAIKPLMREMHEAGELDGPPADLMKPFADEMLYDLKADPEELVNLAGSDSAEHQAALVRMRTALDVWMVETRDRGEIAESREIVAPFLKEMHDWFVTPEWAADQAPR